MKNKVVIRETATVAAGVVLLSAAMAGVFLMLGRFKLNVLWGLLTGCLVAILNFLLLAATAILAADKAAGGEVQQAQKLVQFSSLIRLAAMGVVLGLCLKLGANPLALLFPLLFIRPVLLLWGLIGKKGKL